MSLSREVTLLFGKSQSGKSALLNDLLYNHNRVIIFDPKAALDAEFKTGDLRKLYLHCKDKVFFRALISDPLLFPGLCVMVATMKDVVLAIDEIQMVVMGTRALNAALMDLVFVGTKNRVSLFITTQRPMKLHTDIRSQFTKAIFFNQSEPADLRYIADVSDRDTAERVKALKPHHFISVSWTGETSQGITTAPRKRAAK